MLRAGFSLSRASGRHPCLHITCQLAASNVRYSDILLAPSLFVEGTVTSKLRREPRC